MTEPEPVYSGRMEGVSKAWVTCDRYRRVGLPNRRDLRDHSPTGFAWGYEGSGPSQLALAICSHAIRFHAGVHEVDLASDAGKASDDMAQKVYMDFRRRVVSQWGDREEWTLSHASALEIIRDIAAKRYLEGTILRPKAA